MNIGLAVHFGGGVYDSVKQVARDLIDVLSTDHVIQQLSPRTAYPSASEQDMAAEKIVQTSDVLVGFHSTILPLLAARKRLGRSCSAMVFVLGIFPRGAVTIRGLLPFLTSSDVFVASSSADVSLVRKFFPAAQVQLVPLPLSSAFYTLPAEERREIRRELDVADHSRMLLYAGRITAEKNLHTTLRVFAAVKQLRPDTRLVLAGPIQDVPFLEFGVSPVRYARTLDATIQHLGLKNAVRYLGPVDAGRLRQLYNAADVFVNLTLHHDENFGLGQIEAMACGTPVIGTAWGGLRDTIHDGVNGYRINTVVSPLGVKIDWWDSIDKTLHVLSQAAGARRLTDATVAATRDEYSRVRFGERVNQALGALEQRRGESDEPLTLSEFGREFWDICIPSDSWHPRYTQGPRSLDLYCELITAYASSTARAAACVNGIGDDDVLILAVPSAMTEDGVISTNDPLFPLTVPVPESIKAAVRIALVALAREPVITARRLTGAILRADMSARAAVDWMLANGVVMRSRGPASRDELCDIASYMAEPICRIAHVDRNTTDFITTG